MDGTVIAALIGVAFGSALPWPIKAAWRILRGDGEREESEIVRLVKRNSDLEDLVDLLRKALDKHLIRESAVASACELLIALAALVPKPSDAMLHIRDRAQRLLEDARAHVVRIDGGKS